LFCCSLHPKHHLHASYGWWTFRVAVIQEVIDHISYPIEAVRCKIPEEYGTYPGVHIKLASWGGRPRIQYAAVGAAGFRTHSITCLYAFRTVATNRALLWVKPLDLQIFFDLLNPSFFWVQCAGFYTGLDVSSRGLCIHLHQPLPPEYAGKGMTIFLQLIECVVFIQLSGLLCSRFPRTLYFVNNG
ncbi:hypothetical protein F2P79_013866, partial [Pimephales promelas]